MRFSAQTRLVVLSLSTLIIGACTANTTADASLRSQIESYLADNITDLSPRTATQGNFTVDDVEWIDDDTARVTYSDDAGVTLQGLADIDVNGDIKTHINSHTLIKNFRINTTFRSSSSTSFDNENSSTTSVGSSSMDTDDDSSSSTMNDHSSSSDTNSSPSSVMMDSSLSTSLSY